MEWLLLSFLFGITLAADCFAIAVADGLTISDLTEKKWRPFFIAGLFGIFHCVFPLIGFFLGEALSSFIDKYDHWIALVLLSIIGAKMVYEGIRALVKSDKPVQTKFSFRSIIFQGVADSIDALAVGVTIRANIHASADYQIYICFLIIALCAFGITLLGLLAGKSINKLLRGKYEIANIIGGTILILLGVFICLEGTGVIAWTWNLML